MHVHNLYKQNSDKVQFLSEKTPFLTALPKRVTIDICRVFHTGKQFLCNGQKVKSEDMPLLKSSSW